MIIWIFDAHSAKAVRCVELVVASVADVVEVRVA